jgi:hypothetical protein
MMTTVMMNSDGAKVIEISKALMIDCLLRRECAMHGFLWKSNDDFNGSRAQLFFSLCQGQLISSPLLLRR